MSINVSKFAKHFVTPVKLDKMLETALRATFSDYLLHMSLRHSVYYVFSTYSFSPVQLLSSVLPFATPRAAVRQSFLSITNSRSLLKFTSMESVIPSNHLSLCCPLCLLPSIFPSIRVFYNQSVLPIKWPKYWSFSFSIIPSKEIPGLISFRMDWLDLLAVQGTLKSLLQHHSSNPLFFSTLLSLQSNSHIHT